MQKSTAYMLIKVFKTYVLEYKVDHNLLLDVGKTKLRLLMEKDAITQENVIDQLYVAKELSKRDLLDHIGEIVLNESGHVESQLKKDDAGFFLHVHHSDNSIPPGMYRLVDMERTFGNDQVVCHFKGKIKGEE